MHATSKRQRHKRSHMAPITANHHVTSKERSKVHTGLRQSQLLPWVPHRSAAPIPRRRCRVAARQARSSGQRDSQLFASPDCFYTFTT